MTFTEFRKFEWFIGVHILYNGYNYKVLNMNKEEMLFGLFDERYYEMILVRCENCKFPNSCLRGYFQPGA